MPIATTLNEQLQRYAILFEYHHHSHSPSSARIAEAAQVPGHRLAKSVVLKRQDDSYLMIVLPADHRVQLGQLHRLLGETVGLATETEVRGIFTDCDPGAVVPTGGAYGLKTLIDRHLLAEAEVYIESGDHQNLLRLSGPEFRRLMAGAEAVDASRHL